MNPRQRTTPRYLFAAALAASLACTDRPAPTDPGADPSLAPGGLKGRLRPSITTLLLSSTTLAIGGAGTDYAVTIQNAATFPLSGIYLQGEIVQGSTVRGAGGAGVSCGDDFSVLPPGTCTMQLTATASNSAGGTGSLVAGSAKFVLTLYQDQGDGPTVYDRRTVQVTLVFAPPRIADVTFSTTLLPLDGANVDYTATLENPGPSRSEIFIQGEIRQGTAIRGAGGTVIQCPGEADGVLPTGTCAVPWSARATNETGGTGTLVLGDATFVLTLLQFENGTTTVLDTKTIAVTLVANTASITSLTLSMSGPFDVAFASNQGSGRGTLVAGPATLRLDLWQGGTILDGKSLAIALTSG